MDTPDLATARIDGEQSVKEAADALRKRFGAHRDQLLTLAGYVDTLVDTARVVDTACLDAHAIVAAAEREAEAIRSAALDSSRQLIEEARREVERLRAELAILEGERREIATTPHERRHADGAGVESVGDAQPTSPAVQRMAAIQPAMPGIDEVREPTARERLAGFFEGVTLDPAPRVSEHRSGRLLRDESGWRPWLRGWRLAAVAILAVALPATTWWARGRPAVEAPPAAAPVARATHPVATAAEPAPPPSTPEAPVAVAVEMSGGPAPAKVAVTLRASRAAWLRTGVDGVLDHGGFIAAGEERALSGDRDVEIRTADAGALLVSVNGASETTLGRNGAAASRRWTPEGSDLATSRASATTGAGGPRIDGTSSRAPVATSGVSTP